MALNASKTVELLALTIFLMNSRSTAVAPSTTPTPTSSTPASRLTPTSLPSAKASSPPPKAWESPRTYEKPPTPDTPQRLPQDTVSPGSWPHPGSVPTNAGEAVRTWFDHNTCWFQLYNRESGSSTRCPVHSIPSRERQYWTSSEDDIRLVRFILSNTNFRIKVNHKLSAEFESTLGTPSSTY